MLNQSRLSWNDILQSILLKNKADGNHQSSVRVNNIYLIFKSVHSAATCNDSTCLGFMQI